MQKNVFKTYSPEELAQFSPATQRMILAEQGNSRQKASNSTVATFKPGDNRSGAAAIVQRSSMAIPDAIEVEFTNSSSTVKKAFFGGSLIPKNAVDPTQYLPATGGTFGIFSAMAMQNLCASRDMSMKHIKFISKEGTSWLGKFIHFRYVVRDRQIGTNERGIGKQLFTEQLNFVDPNAGALKRLTEDYLEFDDRAIDLGLYDGLEKEVQPGDTVLFTIQLGAIEEGYIAQ